MILVVGATGLVGNEVCRRLREAGRDVRALVRTTSHPAKLNRLRSVGADLCFGDLKDPPSLAAACAGVEAIISTASSTFSRAAGDSIESVDDLGQLNLVHAAKAAGVPRFVFVSFRRPPGFSFPLDDAKAHVEAALADMDSTVIQASFFMESWLSPALGFDAANATARVFGPGTSPISFVSASDVAAMCALALTHSAASRRTLAFGGPQALTMQQVIALFERLTGRSFTIDRVPAEALHQQFAAAEDPMGKSFAALMLGALFGDAIDMAPLIAEFHLELTSVESFARRSLGLA